MPPNDPLREVERLFALRLRDLIRALLAWAAAKAGIELGRPDAPIQEAAARRRVRDVLVDVFGAADLAGRAQVLRDMVNAARTRRESVPIASSRVGNVLAGRGPMRLPSTVTERTTVAEDVATIVAPETGPAALVEVRASGMVADVPPTPAIEAVVKRAPILARDADEVARLYQTSDAVFSAVHLADEKLAERVKTEIASLIAKGARPEEAAEVLRGLTGWGRSYAETVFVTNASTCYTQGVLAEMQQEGVRDIMLALEAIGPDDVSTRRGRPQDNGENHKAGIGLLAAPDDPVWEHATPPWGYSCRHALRAVSVFELEERGLLDERGRVRRHEPPSFAAFAPHPRFVGTGLLRTGARL